MRSRVSAADLPLGFSYSAAACGLKQSGLDLGLLASDRPASAACVFTRNLIAAAPVILSRFHLQRSSNRMIAILANSGNANCATGAQGLSAARTAAEHAARALGRCRPWQILVCSTGVIGVPLRVGRVLDGIPQLAGGRSRCATSFEKFTKAILTTDTRPKWAATQCRIEGKQIRILGCAKGAGMIHPNLATMLAFIATDAAMTPPLLRRALRFAAARTFNAITIDGDTSTNDTVALLANGASGAPSIRSPGKHCRNFSVALEGVCQSLALQIVRDGEGARRVLEIEVSGAASDRAADQMARTIANSPLVKTALAGADPNWGRILAAAGRSGVPFNPSCIDIRMGGILMCRRGRACSFRERTARRKLLAKHVSLLVDLHGGRGAARVWTCDLTADYVRINSSYRS